MDIVTACVYTDCSQDCPMRTIACRLCREPITGSASLASRAPGVSVMCYVLSSFQCELPRESDLPSIRDRMVRIDRPLGKHATHLVCGFSVATLQAAVHSSRERRWIVTSRQSANIDQSNASSVASALTGTVLFAVATVHADLFFHQAEHGSTHSRGAHSSWNHVCYTRIL